VKCPECKRSTSNQTNHPLTQTSVIVDNLLKDINKEEELTLPHRSENRFGTGLDEKIATKKIFYEKNYVSQKDLGSVLKELIGHALKESLKVGTQKADDLTEYEVAAVHAYTVEGPFYKSLNTAMRDPNLDNIDEFRDYIYYMDQILHKIPSSHKPVYRGINCEVEYKVGQNIVWPAYSSATQDPNVAMQFIKDKLKKDTGTLFMIKPISAKLIDNYSAHPNEKEAILAANSEFLVVNKLGVAGKTFLSSLMNGTADLTDLLIYELEQIN